MTLGLLHPEVLSGIQQLHLKNKMKVNECLGRVMELEYGYRCYFIYLLFSSYTFKNCLPHIPASGWRNVYYKSFILIF